MGQFTFIGIILLSFFCSALKADTSYSLGDVVAFTLLQNPELSTYSFDMRANDARILQASLRPNPALDVETENLDAPKFVQTTLLLSQLIEIGGKRHARIQFARNERDRVFLDYEVKKRQLFVDTTLLFIEVLINQKKIIFLEENLKILQGFSTVVENRVKAGKASMIEEANFSVLLTTSLIDLKNAQNDLKNTKNKLAAQWGETNNDAFVAIGNLDWTPTILPLEEMGHLIHTHPLIMRSHIEENLRDAKIAFEKSHAYPDVNLRGGPRYLNEAKKWVWVIGVSMPLPIKDRNQGRVWEAKENSERIEKEREAIWIKLITELNNAYSTIQTVTSEISLLQNIALPASQKAFDSSYKGYESARYNYLELLETERLYRTSQIRYLQALGEYHKALALLEGITGTRVIINQQCE
jgi:cobalt-zinc-cadmium efflux system outer membrane protein